MFVKNTNGCSFCSLMNYKWSSITARLINFIILRICLLALLPKCNSMRILPLLLKYPKVTIITNEITLQSYNSALSYSFKSAEIPLSNMSPRHPHLSQKRRGKRRNPPLLRRCPLLSPFFCLVPNT